MQPLRPLTPMFEPGDRPVLDLLRAFPAMPEHAPRNVADVLARAEPHGCAGVVAGALFSAHPDLDAAFVAGFERRMVARQLDHAAHLAMLARIEDALAKEGVRGVALKGVLFAERFYMPPTTRATSDIDLLVEEDALDTAIRALANVDYHSPGGSRERRYRLRHHHLHFENPHGPELELHFHAYRGFGAVLASAPLIARSERAPHARTDALRVLSPEDELVYLCVHAASHRFGRIGWLFDIKLLLAHMTDAQIEDALVRARMAGFGRAVALTLVLVGELLGEPRGARLVETKGGGIRRRIARRAAPEPSKPLARSLSRFVFSTALCDSPRSMIRYAAQASAAYARRVVGLDR